MPPIPRPHWKDAERQKPQPLWRRILLGFFNVLTIFGGARAIGAAELPQFIRPLYYRVRLKDAVAATAAAPAQLATVEASAAPEIVASKTHVVVRGDSLWKIAKDAYGSGQRWIDIWRLNSAKIAEADLIYPGQEFLLPDIELHRESGARPGVSVKDITPLMRVVKTAEAPQVSGKEDSIGKTESNGSAKTEKAGAAAESAEVLKNKIQPEVDALAKTLNTLADSVNRYAASQNAAAARASEAKHLNSYAAEAKKLTTVVAQASSKAETISAVADLLDVARDATTTVRQITVAPAPQAPQSPYPGGVYQTSTGAPVALAPSSAPSGSGASVLASAEGTGRQWTGEDTVLPDGTVAIHAPGPTPEYPPGYVAPPSGSRGETGAVGLTVAPAGYQWETLPPGYAWRFYQNDPTIQPDAAYPTGPAPYHIPAGYQVTHQYQTTPTQLIVGPSGDSWIFNTETGVLHPNRVSGALPVSVAAPAAVAVAQSAALSQIAGERVGTVGADVATLPDAKARIEAIAAMMVDRASQAGVAPPSLVTAEQAAELASVSADLAKEAAAANQAEQALAQTIIVTKAAITANMVAPQSQAAIASSESANTAIAVLQSLDPIKVQEVWLGEQTSGGGDASVASGVGSGSITGTGPSTTYSGGLAVGNTGINIGGNLGEAGQTQGPVSSAIQSATGLNPTAQAVIGFVLGFVPVVGQFFAGAQVGIAAIDTVANTITNSNIAAVANEIQQTVARNVEDFSQTVSNPAYTGLPVGPQALATAIGGSFIGSIPGPGQIGNVSFGAGVLGGQIGVLSNGQAFTISSPKQGTLASENPDLTPAQLNEAFKVMQKNIPFNLNPPDEDETDVTPVDLNVVAQNIPDINDLEVADPQNDPNTPAPTPDDSNEGVGVAGVDAAAAAATAAAAAAVAAAADSPAPPDGGTGVGGTGPSSGGTGGTGSGTGTGAGDPDAGGTGPTVGDAS